MKRAWILRLIMIAGLSLLAWTAAAVPVRPDEETQGEQNPLKLTMTGSASRPQMDGTRIEWIITAENTGTQALTGTTLLDTLPPGLALNRVDFERGQTTLQIDRQTITILIKQLEPGANTRIYLYTNASRRNVSIENSVCLQDSALCAAAQVSI